MGGRGSSSGSPGNRTRLSRKATREGFLAVQAQKADAKTAREAAKLYGFTDSREVGAFVSGANASKRGSWGGDMENAEIGYGQSAAHPNSRMVDAYLDGWSWYAAFK